MQANAKTEPTGIRATSPLSLLSDLVQQGVDGYVAAQRIVVDFVNRQNATTMKAVRAGMATAQPVSAAGLAELAGKGMSNFIEVQRVLLNLALRQNDILMTGIKDRVDDPRATAMTNMLRRSVATLIDMQQHFLSMAEKHTDTWVETAKEGKLDTGKGLTEFAREGMEQIVRSQKALLDMIAEETAHATKAGKHPAENKDAAVNADLTDLARQSAEAIIDMQKKILDVAGKQIDVNLDTARRVLEHAPSPMLDVPGLTREYVENFVTAQKALLDIMGKHRHDTPHAAETVPPRRRARRTAEKKTVVAHKV